MQAAGELTVVEQPRHFDIPGPLRHIYGVRLRHDASLFSSVRTDATINPPRQAQLEPTAQSVLAMLAPAVCTFEP